MRSTVITDLRNDRTEEEINSVVVLVDANENKTFSELFYDEATK